ncbi:unnamed protein product [Toxocara canis]|nr:unnamed protein product [Toxocara canis]
MRAVEQQLEAVQRYNKHLAALYQEEKEALRQERQRRIQAEHRLQQLQKQLANNQRSVSHAPLTRRASAQSLRDVHSNTTRLYSSSSQRNLAKANAPRKIMSKDIQHDDGTGSNMADGRRRWHNQLTQNASDIVDTRRSEMPSSPPPLRKNLRQHDDSPVATHSGSVSFHRASLAYFVHVDGTWAWRMPPRLQAVLRASRAWFIRRSRQRQARIEEASIRRAEIAERKRVVAKKVLTQELGPAEALPLLEVDAGRISAWLSTPRTMARDTRRRLHETNHLPALDTRAIAKEEDRHVNRLLAFCYNQASYMFLAMQMVVSAQIRTRPFWNRQTLR